MINFTEYCNLVAKVMVKEQWRPGQTYFNILFQEHDEFARQIIGTDLDPFFDDNRLPEFLARVRDELNG